MLAFMEPMEDQPCLPRGASRQAIPIKGEKPVLRGLEAGPLGILVLTASRCKTMYSHVNRPLHESKLWPDCRATAEIQQPRGQDDVLVTLCLSGGGRRAAWFSAATMLRLERVVDEMNLLHEVDVISSVSCGGLPAA